MGLIVERTKARRDTSGRAVAPEDRERIQAVALYIDDHCASALTVDDLARAACMSPTKFKECFKAVTGSTLTRYVQSRRISQSEGLLRMPDLSIAHRLATVEASDQILVVDGGTVAQRGTHDQLMAEGGTYRRFVEIRRRAEGWRIASDDAVAPAPAEDAPMPAAS